MEEPNPVGRPSAFRPEYVQMLRDHFNIEAITEVTKVVDGKTVTEHIVNIMPTLAGFACKVGHHRATIWKWCEDHEEFRDAYKMAKEHQERILVENGLRGNYEKAFAIFTAKNVINWSDKHQFAGPGGKDLAPPVIEVKFIKPECKSK